ncbi:MAG: SRPBCC domain-containing protein [Phycisphaerales bacterium]|nr:SRPBCC domain-containing protein [Phycisphaerales bacterium]
MTKTKTSTAVSKVFIRGSIEAVWREITKTDELQGCFFNARMHADDLRPGGKIQMRSADGKYTTVVGEILEFDPPHRFAHTFKFTQYDDPPCKVTYDLKEVEGGVEFTLTSEDIPVGTKTEKNMTRGADFIVKTLKAIIENGRPPFGVRMLYGMFKVLTPLTPKKCRTENWT